MTLYLDPAIFRPWLGNATTEDQLIRSLLRHQCTDTGADLFTAAVSRKVAEMLAAKRPTGAIIKVAASHVRTLVSTLNGAVVAALDPGAKREPFHSYHWQKQGHAAAAAIILHLDGKCTAAETIIARLMREQEREDPLAIHGLWRAGTRDETTWPGQWAWVNHVHPFEDCTQVANACALYAFDRLQHFRFAVDGMREVVRRSGVFMVPYCASVRSGLPEWGRAVAPAAWSVEESANVAMLLAAAGHADEAARIRDSLMLARTADGSWARFLDPRSMLPVYVRRDDANPAKPLGIGELTTDRAEAYEAGGYSAPTVRPAMLDAVLPPSKYQEVNP